MINSELERWKQTLEWLDDSSMRLQTASEAEDDTELYAELYEIVGHINAVALRYFNKIKSRENLKKALEDSLSQATDGGKE